MNWKDWLYIPKSDKIAIVSLTVVILVFLIIHFVIGLKPEKAVTVTIPEDYKEWQLQLIEKKEEEKQTYFKEQRKLSQSYPIKMKAGQTIELNSADTTQLKTIPGIGSGYANRIVKYRNALGGFLRMEQLSEVTGMDTYLYSEVVPYLTLESKRTPLYINRASFKELLRHPYLNYKQVQAIEDIRTRKGTISSINRLEMLDEFKERDIELLKSYLSFEE